MKNKESAAWRVGGLAPSRPKCCFGVRGLPSCALVVAAATHHRGVAVQGGGVTDG
jgi:hypothetical protein